MLLSGPGWPFLSCNQLGPDNNTYLAQIITPQNGFLFSCLKNVLKYLFYSIFEHQPKLGKKMGKTNDNFSHFAKHRFIKNPFCCNPLLTKNWCFSTLFLKPKTLMLNKRHNLKSGKGKDKKKGLERKSKKGNQKKRKYFRKKVAI